MTIDSWNILLSKAVSLICQNMDPNRTGGRALDLGGPRVYQRGLKFKIKHKSRCFQKSKIVALYCVAMKPNGQINDVCFEYTRGATLPLLLQIPIDI